MAFSDTGGSLPPSNSPSFCSSHSPSQREGEKGRDGGVNKANKFGVFSSCHYGFEGFLGVSFLFCFCFFIYSSHVFSC
jgi:hypothetical protein